MSLGWSRQQYLAVVLAAFAAIAWNILQRGPPDEIRMGSLLAGPGLESGRGRLGAVAAALEQRAGTLGGLLWLGLVGMVDRLLAG